MSGRPGERDPDTPRWMRLAAALRAEPAPDTLARVRRRLAAGTAAPSWLRWLARPVAVAASAALLIVSAIAGEMLLTGTVAEAGDETALASALLGDDGSFGLGVERTAAGALASPDSDGTRR